jgi:HAD superfamily 5'-nucleotidase-like hydrolase
MRAAHGTTAMSFDSLRDAYRHLPIDLSGDRFYFLNTLFSLSGSCLFAQLVDLYDRHAFPDVLGYRDLFDRIVGHLDQTHVEGRLKAEITADPSIYVEPDPDAAMALLDQQRAGKRLMLISNSDWAYVRDMMSFAYDPHLPDGLRWRDLFELVIVAARKPDFFSTRLPLFSVVDERRGLLAPEPQGLPGPGVYLGGDAGSVERYLGLSGSEILYVGDHIFADVRVSKSILRWRTALVLRELERELDAIAEFRPQEAELVSLMEQKRAKEEDYSRMRLQLQRREQGYGEVEASSGSNLGRNMAELKERIMALDERIAPLARQASQVDNPRWGLLLRAGNDKSHLARQVEASADIYTSRVSNFLFTTPFAYLRSVRGNMPHDP